MAEQGTKPKRRRGITYEEAKKLVSEKAHCLCRDGISRPVVGIANGPEKGQKELILGGPLGENRVLLRDIVCDCRSGGVKVRI